MGLKESRWSSGGKTSTLRTWPQQQQQRTPSVVQLASEQSTSPRDTTYTAATTLPSTGASPERELDRYLKLVARLKWKLPFLAEGYRIATDRVGRRSEDVAANEMHFKIDFYEYYMHIERALVHLMGVFGIKVTGLADSLHNPSNSSGRPTGPGGLGMGVAQSSHRFHANVLGALERPDNPLHEALGQGEVKRQLARAKELRNRWKNVDARSTMDSKGYTPAPLEAYNLENILEAVFAGFDHGHALAELYIHQLRASGGAEPAHVMDWDKEEEDWGFIADAMDWEAI